MKKWIRTILLGVVALLAVYSAIRFQFFPDTGEVKGVPLESVARDISKALPETGSGEVREVPVKGMVTMLDLGADSCIPCKMMAPILAKMEKKYDEQFKIVFEAIRQLMAPTETKKKKIGFTVKEKRSKYGKKK